MANNTPLPEYSAEPELEMSMAVEADEVSVVLGDLDKIDILKE